MVGADAVMNFRRDDVHSLEIASEAKVPLQGGLSTRFVVFRDAVGGGSVAVIVGEPDFSKPVPVRLHSACLTGDVFGSSRCDCGDQLRLATKRLNEEGGGVILYLEQEGRGLGLANKMRAYALQDDGLDTVDANTTLGFDDDERDYGIAARMLQKLGCTRVYLMTNNPAKLDGLERARHRGRRTQAAACADQRAQSPLHDREGDARRPQARPSDRGSLPKRARCRRWCGRPKKSAEHASRADLDIGAMADEPVARRSSFARRSRASCAVRRNSLLFKLSRNRVNAGGNHDFGRARNGTPAFHRL